MAELEMMSPDSEGDGKHQDAITGSTTDQHQQQPLMESVASSGVYLVVAASIAALGGVVFGYDAGWTADVL